MAIASDAARDVPGAASPPPLNALFESCIGCKWTLLILALVRAGVNRPGAIERAVDGLTAKVLSERLAKLTGFGILEKRSFDEVPPRVEYHPTPFGVRFATILDEVEALHQEFTKGQ